MITLEEINETAQKLCKKENVSQMEVFSIHGIMRNAYVENSKIHAITSNSWYGIGIKIVFGKKIGFVSGNITKLDDIELIVKKGIRIAKMSPEDENFRSLPSPKKATATSREVGYDKYTENLSDENIVDFIEAILQAAEKDEVRVMNGLVRINAYTTRITNSLGVDVTSKGTFVFTHFSAKRGMGEGIEKASSAKFKLLDPTEIGNELHRKTILSSKAEAFKDKRDVIAIIKPLEISEMIYSVVAVGANGEHVNKKRSPWVDKLGEKVASEKLTIYDNPLLEDGPRSGIYDDEGVPTLKKAIIEEGTLKTFFYDSYNANIAGTQSTGNGYRRGTRSIENAHRSATECRPSNLEVKPTSKSLDELIQEIKYGIVIEKFAAPDIDGFTGNFALEVRNGIIIENGELKTPIKHALLTGNFYRGLENIFGLANDVKLVENVKVPSIAFSGFKLVGQ